MVLEYIATPSATIKYDTYIGFLEKVNGPDVINTLGMPVGTRVVFLVVIVLFVQNPKIIPTTIVKAEIYIFNGDDINTSLGYTYLNTKENDIENNNNLYGI